MIKFKTYGFIKIFVNFYHFALRINFIDKTIYEVQKILPKLYPLKIIITKQIIIHF